MVSIQMVYLILLSSNPASMARLQVRACRPFLGLDGYHLKGPFEGVLLLSHYTLINNTFHVAIAVVEIENGDS